MKIVSAKFIKGIIGTDDILYDGKFQVAFMGRSNVGKSTLINSLTKKNSLARTSSSPGKTIRMDFFLVNDKVYFVDFPGYGYAKRSWEKREKLAKMILWYLMYSEVKKRLVVLIIVANKVDKVPISQRENQLTLIRNEYKNSVVIPYCSKQKSGSDTLNQTIS